MITHFEAPDPAATYFTKMTQDPATGLLTVDSTECAPRHHGLSFASALTAPCADHAQLHASSTVTSSF